MTFAAIRLVSVGVAVQADPLRKSAFEFDGTEARLPYRIPFGNR